MAARWGSGRKGVAAGARSLRWRPGIVAGILLGLLLPAAAANRPPTVTAIHPRGLQIGSTTRIVVSGTGLCESARLIVPAAPPLDVGVLSASGDRAELYVRIPDEVAPGIYPVRIATATGLSGPVMLGVDRLPQLDFRSTVVALPVALHGQLQGNEVRELQFPGQAGQRVVIDVEAQRLGSKLRPIVRLYAPTNRLLGVARPTKQLAGDTRLDVNLPADGMYRLELQDVVYKAGDPSWFRLKIGDLNYADGVFPLAVVPDVPCGVQLLAGRDSATGWFWPRPFVGGDSQAVECPDRDDHPFTGAAPRVRLSRCGVHEWREDEVRGRGTALPLPAGISGRLEAPGEQDQYAFDVPPGTKLRIEVQADRWGSPLDALLLVTADDGKTLGRADDQPGTIDPGLDLDVPAEISRIHVRVSSLVGVGGEASVYHLSVGPAERPAPTLQTDLDCLNLPAGGRVVVPVRIDHRGPPAPLRLNLPATLDPVVTCSPTQLEATDELGLLAFEAAPTARGVFRASLLAQAVGEIPSAPTRLQTAPFPGSAYQPQWRQDLMVAVNPPAPLALTWSAATPDYLAQGTIRSLGVVLQRMPAAQGPVRLTLISSQPAPLKEVDGRQVVDESRALRLDGDVVLADDQQQGQVSLVTPSDLPLQRWSFALKAELLGADGKEVVATNFTPIRRWATIAPLQVVLDDDRPTSVRAGDEAGVLLRGRVDRHPDFRLPVRLRIQGLAENDPQPEATLSADQSDFELTLRFAKESPARELKELRVLATPVDPTAAQREIRGLSSPFGLQITAADSP